MYLPHVQHQADMAMETFQDMCMTTSTEYVLVAHCFLEAIYTYTSKHIYIYRLTGKHIAIMAL